MSSEPPKNRYSFVHHDYKFSGKKISPIRLKVQFIKFLVIKNTDFIF